MPDHNFLSGWMNGCKHLTKKVPRYYVVIRAGGAMGRRVRKGMVELGGRARKVLRGSVSYTIPELTLKLQVFCAKEGRTGGKLGWRGGDWRRQETSLYLLENSECRCFIFQELLHLYCRPKHVN